MSLVKIVPPFRILQSFSDLFSVKNENPYNGQRPFVAWCPINSLTFLLLTGLLPCWSLCSSSVIPSTAFTSNSLQVLCAVSEMLLLGYEPSPYIFDHVSFSETFTMTLSSHALDLPYLVLPLLFP